MIRKIFGGAAVAATMLALALPAHASGAMRSADFGTNGSVKMSFNGHQWVGEAHVRGLSRGRYAIGVSQGIDYNNDGIADAGSGNILCTFTVRHSGQVTGCRGKAGSLLGTGDWADINQATIYRVEGSDHVDLGDRDFR
jgi:hypothetical protein